MRKRVLAELADLLWKPQLSWRSIIIGLSVLVLGLTVPPAVSVAQTVDQVNVKTSGLVLNRTTKTFDCLATITNSSAAAINGPLLLVVSNITPSSVRLANFNGNDPSGNPYINVAVPTGGLLAGQSISNVLLKFTNSNKVAFTFNSSAEISTAKLALSVPSKISYAYGADGSGAPIVFTITNNGPFTATSVYLTLLMNPYGGPDDFLVSSASSSQGTCPPGMPHRAGGMSCSLQDIAVGSTVTVSVPLGVTDGFFTIESLLACENCVGNVLDGSDGLYDEITAMSNVTPFYDYGPKCTTLYSSCSQMINACAGSHSNAWGSCENQMQTCILNGPGGAAALACAVVGYFGGWVAEEDCDLAACGVQYENCDNNADNEAIVCLDNAWNNCHQWGVPTLCDWCSTSSPAYKNDPVHRFYLGACGPNAPTQLPSVW